MYESQHHKFDLFSRIWEYFKHQYEQEGLYFEKFFMLPDEEDAKRRILKDYFRTAQKEAWQRAKDEILAMLAEIEIDGLKSILDLLFLKEDTPYDYLKEKRELTKRYDDPIVEEMIQ